MIEQFPIIKAIIYNYFNHQIGFGRDEGFDVLKTSIELGDFRVENIKSELILLLESKVDWRKFAIESYLLPESHVLSSDYARDYLLYCIHDAAWPENALSKSDRESIVVSTFSILKNKLKEKEGWLSYQELHLELMNLNGFSELQFFNMNHVFIDGSGIFDLRIIRKKEESSIQIRLKEFCFERDIYTVWEFRY